MIALIAAMTTDRVIGHQNTLPWHIPEDLKHFKETTRGKTVVMGRKTYESLGKPLPNRHNIVISTTLNADVDVCTSVDAAIAKAQTYDEDIFIIGGATIYEQTLDLVDKMYISYVKGEYEGDSYFPEFDEANWEIEEKKEYDKFDLVVYRRKT
ncbi:MAG: dihydrofolate reductase [Candidatus Woesearchaeota archaeon]|nr:dihydrofolate reductase [Candidatus Woesearchaeota archaeon]